MLITRNTCRACGSSALKDVIKLDDQYLASNFSISEKFQPVQRKIPLEVVRCDPQVDQNACGLVQLRHTVPPNLMYSSYGYRSGINETMTAHLGALARAAGERVSLIRDDVVVDIGANDGTLLRQYGTFGLLSVGFEPSNIQPEAPIPGVVFVRDYFSAPAFQKLGLPKAKIITSIAMFYDLENPNAFVADVAACLAPDGVWIFEMSYMPTMLKNASFDTICHEHLEYYAFAPLERLLTKHGLVVADAELNNANGGSIRVTACLKGSPHAAHTEEARERIYAIQKNEFELKLETEAPYRAFRENSERIRTELAALLLKIRSNGKTIYGYGASTKGNVILQYCGITPEHVTAIADRNPAKVGGKTLGTNIPIISEDEMRLAKPDYLLVLPWHFMNEFRAREAQFVERGGKFIVPMPRVETL